MKRNQNIEILAQGHEKTEGQYQIGSVLYLESGIATDSARIGLETNCGGTIVEASLNGTNLV